ncbi:lactonase family protein [Nakamurella lactea]|uniref:lactonase family protein n=1 Tax=Nakamurella lactea TaxID=459515 RepID=UPI000686AC70|nr:beta-propeller fold lactonase family protein [Nakamurella lactea]
MTQATTMYVAGRGDTSDPTGGLFTFHRDGPEWVGRKVTAIGQLSSLAAHPRLPLLYGTSGVGTDGRMHAWRLTGDGAVLITDVASGGAEPCHVCVHPSGRLLIVANYTSGSLATWRLDEAGEPIGEAELTVLTGSGSGTDPDRQQGPHPHQVVAHRERLLVPDLGSDLIRQFRTDGTSIGDEIDARPVPAGTGPRHAAIADDGTVVVSGELAQTVVFPFRDDAAPLASTRLASVARSRPPRNYPGDLTVRGGVGYLANRGHDTIGVFSLGERPRLVAEVDSGVQWPQHLLIADDQLFIAGWDSSQVVSLPLDDAGIPGAAQVRFNCPGAAWLVTSRS